MTQEENKERISINLAKLSQKITQFISTSGFEMKVKLFLLKTRATPTEIYQIQADDSVKSEMMLIVQEQYDSSQFQQKEVVEYDPVIEKNDTHKVIQANEYQSIQTAVENLIKKEKLNQTTNGVDEKQFSDYIIEFEIDNKKYSAIGSFSTVSKMKKFGWFGNLTDNKLKSLDKDGVVGLNGKIDSLIIGNETILVHGVQGFERVFELSKLFSSEAKKTLSSVNFAKHINQTILANLDLSTQNGGRLARRLTKLRNDQSRLDDFFKNIDKLDKIVGNSTHPNFKKFQDVTYDKVNKIVSVPAGKEEQLLNVISDANYQAEVSGHKGYDESR